MNIKELRLKRNMTQKELANAIGVDVSMISKYESGQVIPPTKRLIDILSALGITIDTPPTEDKQQAIGRVSRMLSFAAPFAKDKQSYLDRIVQLGAHGHCELCQAAAPFIDKDGRPYLEVFTIDPKNESLEPTKNKVALCPNCHRKVTILGNPDDIKKLKAIAIKHIY